MPLYLQAERERGREERGNRESKRDSGERTGDNQAERERRSKQLKKNILEIVLKRASTERARQDRKLEKKDKAWHSVERTSKLTSRESKTGDKKTLARSIGFCVIWVCISSSSSSLAKKDMTWHSVN